MAYDHEKIDNKWQDVWQNQKTFEANEESDKPKFYALDMFPYPSGAGLHVGHLASYVPTDIVSRFKRAQGYNVLHPMGYDAFGLPAEQYAIKTGIHPAEVTRSAIENFRQQLKTMGLSFDWSREISTCEPDFYKWTQFIFLKLFERGLAYQKEVPVNWCPALKTVLANEEVIDGKSERGGHPVVRKPMKQWMLKITEYAERLLQDLDKLDWPERTKEGQRNWIGKSQGANIHFTLPDLPAEHLEVFTTRPDTIFGATFMVIAPEHPLRKRLTRKENSQDVEAYCEAAARKSDVDRKSTTEKSGVFTGSYAKNPVNEANIPIWVADYVLMDYGTGAIMAVPGHDTRDFEFAQKFELPIQRVLQSEEALPFEGEGPHVNSAFLDGLGKDEAVERIIQHLEEKGIGERRIQYKLRDWLFSRQRYWGEPFPVVHFDDGATKGVPEDELPVVLPPVADYEPSDEGEPPLARNQEFVEYKDRVTGQKGQRDTDTMPGSAGSSWYFLRYIDPQNPSQLVDFEKQRHWMPVDLYVGGAEHTVGHLLYARFWQKVLFDAGLVSHDEPFQKLAHQGVILGPDGQRMSKSRGNVINPDEVREQFGADAVRMYVAFMGPFEKDKPWSTQGIEGVRRFLDRVWRLCFDEQGQCMAEDEANISDGLQRSYHKAIKKVTEDLESMHLNTAVSAMMILVNDLYKENVRPRGTLKTLAQLLQPFSPHVAEELWSALGGKGLVSQAQWPSFDPELAKDDVLTMGVQVNGKMRGTIEVTASTPEEEAVQQARQLGPVSKAMDGKDHVKTIYKAGKILNLIVQ